MLNMKHVISKVFATAAFLSAFSASAVEITTYGGKISANDFATDTQEELSVDAGDSFALGIAWNDGPNGQGQFLFTSTNHEFETSAGTSSEIDVIYAHFNGVAQFRQQNYVTTVSIGLGGAYYDVKDGNDDLLPSFTAALGTRYKINENFAVVTELRGFVTLTDDDSDLFCPDDVCIAQFESSLWIETSVSVGVAYSF